MAALVADRLGQRELLVPVSFSVHSAGMFSFVADWFADSKTCGYRQPLSACR